MLDMRKQELVGMYRPTCPRTDAPGYETRAVFQLFLAKRIIMATTGPKILKSTPSFLILFVRVR